MVRGRVENEIVEIGHVCVFKVETPCEGFHFESALSI